MSPPIPTTATPSSLKTPASAAEEIKSMTSLATGNQTGKVQSTGLSFLRNIGIIAHIDAGKTTVSERILFYTGRTRKIGETHDGGAVMDHLQEERERGITITSAATTCRWGDHIINIIDTPGHVDFTAEVERSLRVLDGAVGVFDGVAGVEAQSETVWRQADKYGVPRIAFVNKLDRVGADFQHCLETMVNRLGVHPVPITIPIGLEANYKGNIHLLGMKARLFQDGEDSPEPVEADIPESMMEEALLARHEMVEAACMIDDALLEAFLEEENSITDDQIKAALRKGTLEGKLLLVLCGAALRNKGVPALIDATCDFLPSPLDMPSVEGHDSEGNPVSRQATTDAPFAALAFKTVHDPNGDLTFCRVYSGKAQQGDQVVNPSVGKNKKERLGRIYRMHAASREPLESCEAGDIVAIVGLKHTHTGDTLADEAHLISLETVEFPETVISMSIEPHSKGDRDRLSHVLSVLSKEDPTFQWRTDDETSETIIAGMGELHLEVLRHRIIRDFKIPCECGRPRVAYRQTFRKEREVEARHIKQTGGSGQFAVAKILFTPDKKGLDIEFDDKVKGGNVPQEYIPAVGRGIVEQAAGGAAYPFPYVGFKALLLDGKAHDVDSSDMAFKSAGKLAFRMAAEENHVFLEPIMKFEVLVPEEYLGDVIGDLNRRRAQIGEVDDRLGVKLITGYVPIAEMFSYSSTLRSLTAGRGTYSMEPDGYQPVPQSVAEDIRRDIEEQKRKQ